MKVLIACIICLPLHYLRLTSGYGYRIHPLTGKFSFHAGIDLRADHDTVFAVMDGCAREVNYDPALGIHIRIDHENAQSIYGHLSRVFVSAGEFVEAGEPIGITGATGKVTGEHLHFGIRSGNRWVDPLQFIYQILINNKKS